MRDAIEKRFPECLSEEEKQVEFDFKSLFKLDLLINRFERITGLFSFVKSLFLLSFTLFLLITNTYIHNIKGVSLSEQSLKTIIEEKKPLEFVEPDVTGLYPKIKHLNIIDYYTGLVLLYDAETADPKEALRLLDMAIEKLTKSVLTNSTNIEAREWD